MPSPLDLKNNDLRVIFVPPTSPTDPRVPTAEETSLNSQIIENVIAKSRTDLGWLAYPQFSISSSRRLAISGGEVILPIYPGSLKIDTAVTVPSLTTTTSTVKQIDTLYLASFSAEVGAAQDTLLGQYSFQYKDRNTNQITTISKENTRRSRAFWLLVLSSSPLSASSFLSQLPADGADRKLTLSDTSEIGFGVGTYRVYGRDSNLLLNATYKIFANSFHLLPVCQIRRLQNFTDRGYIWGNGGEGGFSPDFHILSTPLPAKEQDLDSLMRSRLREVFSSRPGNNCAYNRSVQNLVASSVGNNPGIPGEAAGSPNGSVCLANDQRVSFTNQAIIQKTGAQILTATNNGSGNAVVSCVLNTNSPSGTFFSANRYDHKIYSASGVDETDRGSFSNLGGSGTLLWIGDTNTSIRPGQTVYAVPGIYYPSGSGFSIGFHVIEQAWRNAAAIAAENIRAAHSNDVEVYATPGSSQEFFVIGGRERAALHYILKRISITTSATGVATIPSTERGCFAFIEGVSGRIDAPIKTGLAASRAYQALVYYPPRSNETWQFLLKYGEYQGTGATEPTFLNGAKVVSKSLFFLHTQGGGSAVHQGDGATRVAPISMYLPSASGSPIPSYRFNAPIQMVGEPYPGPVTLREVQLLPSPALVVPTPGQALSIASRSVVQARSLSVQLLADGQPVGFRAPLLASRSEYQSVLAFIAQKGTERRLVIITANTTGAESITADSDRGVAIDTFQL